MPISRRMRSISALVTVLMLLFSALAMPALAESSIEQNDRSIFFGKLTQIDGDYVTIAIGTMDLPQIPDSGNANGQNNAQSGNPPAQGEGQRQGGRNYLSNLTLTGELVTVQITSAVTLTKQGAWPERQGADATFGTTVPQDGGPGQGNAPARPEGTPPASDSQQQSRQGGFGGMYGANMFGGETATFSDLAVDAIVMLTYQTSTQALLSVHILSLPETQSP